MLLLATRSRISLRCALPAALLLFGITTICRAGAAQAAISGPQQPNEPYRLKVTTQTAVLDVVVTDRQGHPVTNLKRDDFTIYDDKTPQTIQTFDPPPSVTHAPNPPVHSTADLDRLEPSAPVTLIVLDEINTTFQDEAFGRYSLEQFLKHQGETLDHPTLLGAVDIKHFTLLHDYTTSKQELLNALHAHKVIYPEQTEGTNWQAQQYIASFAGLLEVTQSTAGHPGHKTLLWVGRGFPPFDPTALSENDNAGLEQVLDSCVDAMRDARMVLYTLDPAGVTTEAQTADPETGFLDDPFNGELDFSKLATASGGHSFFGRNDVDKLIAVASTEGLDFYTLSYKPSTPITDTRAFHNIRVVMKDPNLTAETRTGYYAHSPAPPEHVGSSHANRQVFDLGLAFNSAIPYDGVHFQVARSATDADTFSVTMRSNDLSWVSSKSGQVITKITVVAAAFDAKGNMLARAVKLSTLQDTAAAGDSAADPTVKVNTSIATHAPATTMRLVIRDEASGRIGALSFPLSTASGTPVAN